MPNSRFFDIAAPLSGSSIVDLVDGNIVDGSKQHCADDVMIAAVASAEDTPSIQNCVFVADKSVLPKVLASGFGICLVGEKLLSSIPDGAEVKSQLLVCVQDAQLAFIQLANNLYTEKNQYNEKTGRGPEEEISADAKIHPSAILSQGVQIGEGTQIGPNVVIGPGVKIGKNCQIGANVTITHTIMEDGVNILSGAAIGQAGFGFVPGNDGLVRMPQLGRVLIRDCVEIGANTTIDRGTLGDTIIGEGTRIDNQVQIAHNVILGKNCILAAHTGISGSCVVGDNVLFGGRAGLADHLHIGDGARVAANAGCMKDIPAGETWAGTPARPIRKFMREVAMVAKLADSKKKKD